MIKLLKTNFYRLLKEKTVLLIIALSFLVGLAAVLLSTTISDEAPPTMENLFLMAPQSILALVAIALPLYVGREFYNNTIRNKVATGYSKAKVYLSCIIVSVCIGLSVFLAYQIAVLAIGMPLYGWGAAFVFTDFIMQLVNLILIFTTVSAIYGMICMLTRSLPISILVNVAVYVLTALLFTFLDPSQSAVINFIMKVVVFGQYVLITGLNTLSFMIHVIISSAVVLAAIAVIGRLVFERMDLK